MEACSLGEGFLLHRPLCHGRPRDGTAGATSLRSNHIHLSLHLPHATLSSTPSLSLGRPPAPASTPSTPASLHRPPSNSVSSRSCIDVCLSCDRSPAHLLQVSVILIPLSVSVFVSDACTIEPPSRSLCLRLRLRLRRMHCQFLAAPVPRSLFSPSLWIPSISLFSGFPPCLPFPSVPFSSHLPPHRQWCCEPLTDSNASARYPHSAIFNFLRLLYGFSFALSLRPPSYPLELIFSFLADLFSYSVGVVDNNLDSGSVVGPIVAEIIIIAVLPPSLKCSTSVSTPQMFPSLGPCLPPSNAFFLLQGCKSPILTSST